MYAYIVRCTLIRSASIICDVLQYCMRVSTGCGYDKTVLVGYRGRVLLFNWTDFSLIRKYLEKKMYKILSAAIGRLSDCTPRTAVGARDRTRVWGKYNVIVCFSFGTVFSLCWSHDVTVHLTAQ